MLQPCDKVCKCWEIIRLPNVMISRNGGLFSDPRPASSLNSPRRPIPNTPRSPPIIPFQVFDMHDGLSFVPKSDPTTHSALPPLVRRQRARSDDVVPARG